MELHERLNRIFCEVFYDDDIKIVPEMTPNDIDNWDSLSHLTLIAAIEAKFGITFSSEDLRSFKNIGELSQCIFNKLL